jgi:hypothetical protein
MMGGSKPRPVSSSRPLRRRTLFPKRPSSPSVLARPTSRASSPLPLSRLAIGSCFLGGEVAQLRLGRRSVWGSFAFARWAGTKREMMLIQLVVLCFDGTEWLCRSTTCSRTRTSSPRYATCLCLEQDGDSNLFADQGAFLSFALGADACRSTSRYIHTTEYACTVIYHDPPHVSYRASQSATLRRKVLSQDDTQCSWPKLICRPV